MAEVVKARAYFRYADGFSANNLMHAAVDNIYEFSKRFIGIFLKYLQNEETVVETSSEISSMLMFS
jgi:hypothetical protein